MLEVLGGLGILALLVGLLIALFIVGIFAAVFITALRIIFGVWRSMDDDDFMDDDFGP